MLATVTTAQVPGVAAATHMPSDVALLSHKPGSISFTTPSLVAFCHSSLQPSLEPGGECQSIEVIRSWFPGNCSRWHNVENVDTWQCFGALPVISGIRGDWHLLLSLCCLRVC